MDWQPGLLLTIPDSDDVTDWQSDFAGWLQDGENITSAVFTVEAGLTKESEANDASTATVWLSGGTAGATYPVSCKISTSLGRTIERSVEFRVADT